ncbi:MAG: hypothetical protein RR561_03155 [Peptostreptococcus sp.]|uniref:hypothetical protein n=1 Tax=Peptostreptococcus sp. TaxID=1262 RepID=UPI002FC8CB44
MKRNIGKKGSVTINTIITMFFVICIITSSIIATKGLYKLSTENKDMSMKDYEAKLAESLCQINFYYSIEEAYIKSNGSEEFCNSFNNFASQYFINVFEKKYCYSDKVSIDYFYDKENIIVEDAFVEFSIVIKYKNKSIERNTIKRCMIENPYKKFSIGKNEKKLNLTKEEVKNLFKYLD